METDQEQNVNKEQNIAELPPKQDGEEEQPLNEQVGGEEPLKEQEEEPSKEQEEVQQQPERTRSETRSSRKSRKSQIERVYGGGGLQQQRAVSQRSFRNTKSQLFIKTADQFNVKIVHDQINSSHAKMQYSFPKATRFTKSREAYCSTQFYDCQLQSQLNKRGSGLGYGNKSDFTKCDKYRPGPTTYDIRNQFEINMNHQKGPKFGLGRSETSKLGLLGIQNTNPGPGTYQAQNQKSSIKFSLGERTSAKHIYLESTTPAPGTYDLPGMRQKGDYYIAKFKSSGAAIFSPTSSHIIQQRRVVRQPGPGTYKPLDTIGEQPDRLPSNFQQAGGYKFGVGHRQTIDLPKLKTPGPGTYSVPSEFGDVDFPAQIIK